MFNVAILNVIMLSVVVPADEMMHSFTLRQGRESPKFRLVEIFIGLAQ
jgi:hypothetical protein